MKAKPPHQVDVPFGKRPPKGVLWAGGELLLYHAQRRHYSRLLGCEVGPEPARLEEFRELVRGYVSGRGDMTGGWDYYRGRNVACPYRCALDSKTCPVDVLVEEITVATNDPAKLDVARIPPRTTVYPAKAWAFPAVSFRTVEDALDHISSIRFDVPCGICSCPAASYDTHFPGTL